MDLKFINYVESSTSLGINFFFHKKVKGVGHDLDDPKVFHLLELELHEHLLRDQFQDVRSYRPNRGSDTKLEGAIKAWIHIAFM